MSKHRAVAATALGTIDEIQVLTDKPGPDEILLKNEFGAMIPGDAYQTDTGFLVQQYPLTLGFSAAGTIVEVGSEVPHLKVGDKVVAYSLGDSKAKALQQYCVLSWTVVGKIDKDYPLQHAVTFPDNFVTAYYTLFGSLNLPIPDSFPPSASPLDADSPFLLYGAGSSSGQYILQLLTLSGYRNILATASSRHHELFQRFGASHIFDYKSPTLVEDIKAATGGQVKYAIDTIAADSTLPVIGKVVNLDSKIAILLPVKQGANDVAGNAETKMLYDIPEETRELFPKGAELIDVRTFFYQKNPFFKNTIMPKVLPQLLESRLIQPNRIRLFDKGSFKERVEEALELFRKGRVRGEKVVIQIPQ